MDHANKFFITITGTFNSPWDKNWKECVQTWGKELIIKGYDLKIVAGDPNMDTDYEVKGNFLYVKCDDTKLGLVDKAFLSNKYFIEQTDCEYHVRVDSDTFVHPERFDDWCKEILTKENIDYLGCVLPYFLRLDVHYSYLPITNEKFASGTMYFLSRKSSQTFINNYTEDFLTHELLDGHPVDEVKGWDDRVVGTLLWVNGIKLTHDSRIFFDSKWNNGPDAHWGKLRNNSTLEIIWDPMYITTTDWLVAQHYCSDHMEELIQWTKTENTNA